MPAFKSIGLIPAPIPRFLPHSHETWEICLYTRGTGIATVGGREISFAPGDIICMPPRISHQERSESGYTNIYIHTDDYPAGRGRTPVFKDGAERPFFHLAMHLHREFHLKQPNWKLVTQNLFDILLLFLNRWEECRFTRPEVERLKGILVDNLHRRDFDVGQALRGLPMSPDHLRRRFLKALGLTPLKYLERLRIDEARRLLRIGGFSIKEVALRSGFGDQYYFSRVFRKVVHMSPSAFVMAKEKD